MLCLDSEIYFGYVYKTTDLLNGKIYIGQKHGKFDIHYLGSGINLWKRIKEIGRKNFKVEVLGYIFGKYTQNEKTYEQQLYLNNLEQYYISLYNSTDPNIGYNSAKGGQSVKSIIMNDEVKAKLKWSDERKRKRSEQISGKNHPMYGYIWNDEQKEHFRQLNTGEKNPMFNRRGKDSPFSKPIVQLDENFNLVRRYDCVKAVKKYGYSDGTVSSVCGRFKYTRKDRNNKLYIKYKYKNYYWFYEKEYNSKTINELKSIIDACKKESNNQYNYNKDNKICEVSLQKAEEIAYIVNELIDANIDFTKTGCFSKANKIIKCHYNSTSKWIKIWCPWLLDVQR